MEETRLLVTQRKMEETRLLVTKITRQTTITRQLSPVNSLQCHAALDGHYPTVSSLLV